MKNTALITGASSGIGKELAKIHAAKGGDLVIIARSEDKLKSLKSEIENQYGVDVMIIAKDLEKAEAPKEIFDEVTDEGVKVEYLINNAGFGGRGKFHEREWEKDLAMINLNITALTALTRFFLPGMVERNSGKILNVSSTASYMPGPLQAVYYATKAYVTFFSNAIAEELYDTKITVTALLPGATETGFASAADLEKTELFKKTASAYQVALDGYNGMIAGKLDVVSGLTGGQKMMMAMLPILPKKMLLKQVREMQEEK
jgi:short-subunit dehydrogenase